MRPSFSASGRAGLTSSSTVPALDVHRVRDELPGEGQPDRLGDLGTRLLLRLRRARAQMRRPHHRGDGQQRVAVGGLGAEHVDRRPGHPAFTQRQRERLLVHDAAPGCVHDPDAGLDQMQFLVAQEPDRLRVLREVDGDEVSLAQQLLEAGQPHAELGRAGGGHVRVVGDDPHAERAEPGGHQDADTAQAEDPGHLAVEFDPREGGPLPLASPQRGGGLRHVAGHGQEQADGMLGGTDDVGGGCVHHHHARPGRRLHVHVVQADPGARDHPEPGGMGQRLRIDPGGAAHDDRVGVRERGQQRPAVSAVRVPHVEVGFQLRDSGRRKLLGDEDDRCRHGVGPS